jgi:hypothetical protein
MFWRFYENYLLQPGILLNPAGKIHFVWLSLARVDYTCIFTHTFQGPLSILSIFQFNWWRKPEYLVKTTDLSQVTDKVFRWLATGRWFPPLIKLITTEYKNPTNRVDLVQSGHHHHFIGCRLFSPWYRWKIAHLALIEQSLTHYIKLIGLVGLWCLMPFSTIFQWWSVLLVEETTDLSQVTEKLYQKTLIPTLNIIIRIHCVMGGDKT